MERRIQCGATTCGFPGLYAVFDLRAPSSWTWGSPLYSDVYSNLLEDFRAFIYRDIMFLHHNICYPFPDS